MVKKPGKRAREESSHDQALTQARCKRPPPSPSLSANNIDLYDIPPFSGSPQYSHEVGSASLTQVAASYATAVSHRGAQSNATTVANATAMELNDADYADISNILSGLPGSKRYAFAIEMLVERSVSRIWPADSAHSGVAPALTYFYLIRNELGQRHSGPELAMTVHAALVSAWQEKVALWLGSSIRSFERLGGVVQDIVSQAEQYGGLPARQGLKHSLHDAILDITPSSQPHPTLPQHDVPTHEDNAGAEVDATMLDAHDRSGDSVVCITDDPSSTLHSAGVEAGAAPRYSDHPASRGVEEAKSEPPDSQKYPTPYSFYRHHARRVKKEHLGDGFVKKLARDEIKTEWASLTVATKQSWTDLHTRLLGGETWHTNPVAVEHYFHKGRAIDLYINPNCRDRQYGSAQAGSSGTLPGHLVDEARDSHQATNSALAGGSATLSGDPVDEMRVPIDSANTGSSATLPGDLGDGATDSQQTIQRPQIRPVRITYRSIKAPEKTIFLRSKLDNLNPRDVGLACRDALNTAANSRFEAATNMRQQIYTVRFEDVRAARKIAGDQITVNGIRHLVYPYPTQSPQAYIASVGCTGPRAIRPDRLFAALVKISNQPNAIHLRREQVESYGEKKWVIIFRECPGLLRFTIPLQQAGGNSKSVRFEPVSPTGACQHCSMGHPAWKCDLMTRVSANDLGLNGNDPSFLPRRPRIL